MMPRLTDLDPRPPQPGAAHRTDVQADPQAHRELLPLARRLAPLGRRAGFPLRWSRSDGAAPRLPMVGWFDPGQLIATGFRAATSAIVGEQSDRRVVQAIAERGADVHDYSTRPGPDGEPVPRDGLWIDYLSDTGDGFNPTYACAYLLAQPELALDAPDGTHHRLPRADVLVLGGDEVYPAPSREAYQQRLVAPFETASAGLQADTPPHVFAVPGNHDWYDGLSAFLRLFCSDIGGRGFGAWQTRQTRSYFALRLPGRWWLLGADSQLQGDLDTAQIAFFESVAEQHMARGDRVLLCLSTPVWVHAHKYRRMGRVLDETDLLYLRERVFVPRGIELKVYLSGDLHHYRRHEETEPADPGAPVQKITAGGGGAFLHPTHDEDVAVLDEAEDSGAAPGLARRFAMRSAYPSLKRSWWLSFGNLAFGWINPQFGIVPALLYFMTAWLVAAAVGFQRPQGVAESILLTTGAFATNPGLTLWVAAVVSAFIAFNATRSVLYRVLGGLAHTAVHWVCIFHVGWGAIALTGALLPGWGFLQFVAAGALVFAGGWVVGSAVMGLYLLVSLNVFGRHSEEAFSAMRIQDFKNFLRLHVAADGTLTIHPVRIDRVPRRWRDADGSAPGHAGPPGERANPAALLPDGPLVIGLIEPPIVLRPGHDGGALA
jgi:3',5'-cyclic AMP phosphodiesterase CpdA